MKRDRMRSVCLCSDKLGTTPQRAMVVAYNGSR